MIRQELHVSLRTQVMRNDLLFFGAWPWACATHCNEFRFQIDPGTYSVDCLLWNMPFGQKL